jgi:hypothetical protein
MPIKIGLWINGGLMRSTNAVFERLICTEETENRSAAAGIGLDYSL